ncbi:hypothetical protein HKX48_005265 [Thoreauomyces humboldtii]|nr:hypothetical protein HKX48_005265 [Thoreauomyces humboldtii]
MSRNSIDASSVCTQRATDFPAYPFNLKAFSAQSSLSPLRAARRSSSTAGIEQSGSTAGSRLHRLSLSSSPSPGRKHSLTSARPTLLLAPIATAYSHLARVSVPSTPSSPRNTPLPQPSHTLRYAIDGDTQRVETELSTVEFARDTQDGDCPVVIKRLNEPDTVQHELRVLNHVMSANLPHALHLRDTYADPFTGERVLVFPRLESLNTRRLDLSAVADFTRQIATGLAAAHASGIAHLDITQANLMLDPSTRKIVIIDWGLARFCDDATPHPVGRGTPGYIAPEMYSGTAAGTASDIYSFGVILGQWLEPYLPDCSLAYLGSRLVRPSTTSYIIRSIQDSPMLTECSGPSIVADAGRLLMAMLDPDPATRITADEILTHPFLKASSVAFEGTTFAEYEAAVCRARCGGRSTSRGDIVVRYR